MKPRILVTPRSATKQGHPALERLTAAGYELVMSARGTLPTEEELLGLLPGCVGYLAGVEKISANLLEAASPTLRAISRNGTGADAIDHTAAERLGIQILRAEGSNARGVVELTIGLMFALARQLPATDRALKGGAWERFPAFELRDRTLGVIGCGHIGKRVIELACGLGMRVLAHDARPSWTSIPGAFEWSSLPKLLINADIVTLHTPPAEDGRPILGAAELALLRHGACLINTARAGLVDAEALLAALDRGDLGGAALDVFDQEPPLDRRLLEHERVIATPHIGGYTQESIGRAMEQAVENLLQALRP